MIETTGWRKSRASTCDGACVEVGDWRTASYSAGNSAYVEIGQGDWRKSRRSNGHTECVEVCSGVAVRDSKNQGEAALAFTPAAWREFITDIKGDGQD